MKPCTSRYFRTALAALTLFAAALGSTATAQILWSLPAAVSGPSDIPAIGTYVDALQANGSKSAAYTVDDTIFHFSSSHNDGLISLTPGPGASSIGSGTGGTISTPSLAYNNALALCGYVRGTGAYGDVNLLHLTIGHTYEVEVWDLPYTSVLSGVSNVTLSAGDYVLGTFKASSSSLTFTWTTNANSYAAIDAVALRDVTEVPEPASCALVLAGLGALVIMARRRQAA